MGLLDFIGNTLLNDDNKVDPFAAAGIMFGAKGDNITDDDLTMLGTVLGASGAFDDGKSNGKNE